MDLLGLAGRFLDLPSLLIVVGGSAIGTAIRVTRDDLASGFAALVPLVTADPAADAHAARVAVQKVRALSEIYDLACVDRVRTAAPFLRRAAFKLSEVQSADQFRTWGDEEIAAMKARHDRAQGVWRALSDSAPAMGMIGTVIGLVQMFASMDDANAIGPAMALAMLTTLYGLLLSAGFAVPVAARLERLSAQEAEWRCWAIARFETIARAELDPTKPSVVERPAPRTRTIRSVT